MIEFVQKLKKEVEADIRRIEAMDANSLKKSLEAFHVLGAAFNQLKTFILAYNFRDDAEEIYFFKHIKPLLCSHLIYYRKIYNIEMNRPVGSIEAQRAYLHHELDRIHEFQHKRQDFYRYLRSGATSLDTIYFMRGKTDMELYLETFYYERDPLFSTNCDFKVARIMANDMLQVFIQSEVEALEESRYKNSDPNHCPLNVRIHAKKTDIIEMLYGLDTVNFFGDVSLKRITAFVERWFNIDLGNISRTFAEMKSRNVPTPFFDKIRDALLNRMGRK